MPTKKELEEKAKRRAKKLKEAGAIPKAGEGERREAKRFLGEREKRIGALEQTGLTLKQARRQATLEIGEREAPERERKARLAAQASGQALLEEREKGIKEPEPRRRDDLLGLIDEGQEEFRRQQLAIEKRKNRTAIKRTGDTIRDIVKSVTETVTGKEIIGEAAFISGFFGIGRFTPLNVQTRRINAIDGEMQQIRETIIAPITLVRNGGEPLEALDILDGLEDQIDSAERQYQELRISSPEAQANPEFLNQKFQRTAKLKIFIRDAKNVVATAQFTGEVDREALEALKADLSK